MPWFLRPAWLGGHLLVVASALVMVRLGIWQWHVAAKRHGDLQDLAYAFQWWAFSGFALLLWARVLRDHKGRPAKPGPVAVPGAMLYGGADVAAVTGGSSPRASLGAGGSAGYRAYVMPQSDQIGIDGKLDEQMQAYNRYLRALDAPRSGPAEPTP